MCLRIGGACPPEGRGLIWGPGPPPTPPTHPPPNEQCKQFIPKSPHQCVHQQYQPAHHYAPAPPPPPLRTHAAGVGAHNYTETPPEGWVRIGPAPPPHKCACLVFQPDIQFPGANPLHAAQSGAHLHPQRAVPWCPEAGLPASSRVPVHPAAPKSHALCGQQPHQLRLHTGMRSYLGMTPSWG